jgi:amino acid adenylation domain-containing protein
MISPPGSRSARSRRAPYGAPIPPTSGFVPFPREDIERSIPERFEKQVAANHARLAIKSGRLALSYGALNQLANRVAHALLDACGPRSLPIALLLEKDAPYVAAILGILKAGKFYVPLDPSYPRARNQLILADAQAPVLITDDANLVTAYRLGGDATTILNLDVLDPQLDDSDPGLIIPPEAYAYILYTSDSTGRLKGIVETHRNVLHAIMNFTNNYFISDRDRITGINSFAFNGSLKDTFGSLLNGAAFFPIAIERIGPPNLGPWLIREEMTIFTSVCTIFRQFAGTLTGREPFPRIRVIRLDSEPMSWKDVELFKAHFPRGCVLVNGYGTTETSKVGIYAIDHDTLAVGCAVPVGYPVQGQEVLVLDEVGRPLDVNLGGQIAVRSAYLSPGYWRQPDLTQKAFLPDPEGGDRRIYLTGDRGVLEPDGCLIHVGRQDFQVQVRGHRIETSAIETALREVPGVAEAVVMVRSELPDDDCLAAYVVCARDAAQALPSSRTLRDFLKERLPEWSIPAVFVFLESLPLTPTGKIDRGTLPAPHPIRVEPVRAFTAPRTELEARLIAIWEELTEFRPIGIDDDFFELGGDSLLGASLFAKIHNILGKNLPLETLSYAPTIERLAQLLSDTLGPPSERPGIIALKASGSQLPFFAIPGTATHPLTFYHLAHLSDPEQPFFGLVYPEPSPERPYPTRIEDMAERLLPDIRRIQPQGPYRLGGHSFGGVVAFEVANQLIALGHEVSLLALFDTWGNGFPTVRPLPWRILDHLKHMETLRSQEKFAYLAERIAALRRRITYAIRWLGAKRAARDSAATFLRIQAINHKAWARYRPTPYPGRLVLFRAERTPNWVGYRFEDPFLGWGSLATQGVEVHTVPSDHWTVLHRENVPPLAHILSKYLRE